MADISWKATFVDAADVIKSAVRNLLRDDVAHRADDAAALAALSTYSTKTFNVDGYLYELDAADTTTAHSPPTCIVTADGLRYKPITYTGKGAVPSGGTSGYALTKASAADYDLVWALLAASGAPTMPQGRLTPSTGVRVPVSTVSGATTMYYTPAVGRYVPIYSGSAFVMTDTGGELSQATTDATKSPAACANNSGYDVFVWDDGGTIRATRGPAWSSLTARGTGAATTELESLEGRYVNKYAITNGPAAQRGTYVGSFRTNGSAAVDFIFGGSNTTAKICVYNHYNQIPIRALSYESTASWAYTTGTTRRMNNNANIEIQFFSGDADVTIDATAVSPMTASSTPAAGIGLDSTSTVHADCLFGFGAAGGGFGTITSVLKAIPGLGHHYVAPLEFGNTGATFYGVLTASTSRAGIVMMIEA